MYQKYLFLVQPESRNRDIEHISTLGVAQADYLACQNRHHPGVALVILLRARAQPRNLGNELPELGSPSSVAARLPNRATCN